MKSKNKYLLLAGALFIGCTLVILNSGLGLEGLKQYYERLQNELEELSRLNPFLLIAFTAVLPLFGFPMTILYVISGTLYPLEQSITVSIAGMLLNATLAYFIGRYLFRNFLKYMLAKMGYQIPLISQSKQVPFNCLIRIIPGIPFNIQNYLLSIGNTSFLPYIVIAWPIQCIWILGVIISADGLIQGEIKLLTIGFGLIAVLIIASHYIKKRYVHKRDKKGSGTNTERV